MRKILAISVLCLFPIFSTAADDTVVASGFTGDFVNEDTPIFTTVDDWARDNFQASVPLSELAEEGWEIKQVVKTNQSAQKIQLLFFFEIAAEKYPATKFAKIKSEKQATEEKEGSKQDL